MIVSAMNCQEIVKEYALDYNSVINKSDRPSRSLRRECIKKKTKKMISYLSYCSPRKNNWIIILNYTHPEIILTTAVHYLNSYGAFNAMVSSNLAAFHHFSRHFLERYNERFLKRPDLSKMEIFKNYLIRNDFAKAEYLESDQVYMKVSDGYVFGITEDISKSIGIIHYTTFISDEMVMNHQKSDFNNLTDKFRKYFEEHPGEKKLHFS